MSLSRWNCASWGRNYIFSTVLTSSSDRKWCPLRCSFSFRKRWKSDKAKSGAVWWVLQDSETKVVNLCSHLYACVRLDFARRCDLQLLWCWWTFVTAFHWLSLVFRFKMIHPAFVPSDNVTMFIWQQLSANVHLLLFLNEHLGNPPHVQLSKSASWTCASQHWKYQCLHNCPHKQLSFMNECQPVEHFLQWKSQLLHAVYSALALSPYTVPFLWL
jgi:hypothetical protein